MLYPSKTGTVADLLAEARKQLATLTNNTTSANTTTPDQQHNTTPAATAANPNNSVNNSQFVASAKLRLVEISSFKISSIPLESMSLDTLTAAGTRTFRVEEVPSGEQPVLDDEILVPVAHFHKEAFSTFGTPFLLKLKQGESVASVREKIQKRLDVPDKEFEKYRLAIVVMGRHTFLADGDHVNIGDFKCHSTQGE